MKKHAINLIKFTVTAGLIYFLVRSGKMTLDPFIQMWHKPWLIGFSLATFFVIIFINNYRWVLLLRGQKIDTSVAHTLPLNFISLFLSLFLPGTIGGDLVKGYYIVKDRPKARMAAAASVLMDRLVGLYAMAILAFLTILFNWEMIEANPNLTSLAYFVGTFVFAFFIFFTICFSRRVRTHQLTEKLLQKMPFSHFVTRVYDTIHAFTDGRKEFLIGIGLSLIVQSINISSLFFVASNMEWQGQFTLASFFFVIPLGLIVMAVPVSLAGLGVGQAAFSVLFSLFPNTPQNLGADIVSIFQATQAVMSLVGAYFYFTRKAVAAEMAAAEVGEPALNLK